MTSADLGALVKGLAPVLKEYVSAITAGMTQRLDALESREIIHGRDGAPGVKGLDGLPGAQGPPGELGPQGLQGEPGPVGEKGLDGIHGREGGQGPVGPVGPAGEQGAQGASGERGEKGESGALGERGPDGPPGIAGRDGLPGVQGPKGLDGLDGTHGKDGADGLRPDDFDFAFDAKTRSFTVRFVRDGVLLKEVSTKVTGIQIYRGVYVSSTTYEEGDTVTYGGSQWCAKEDTSAEPNEHAPDGKRAWQLCIQRGRTGKQGLSGTNGRDGKEGRPGRDLTQLGPDGSKW